MNNLKTYLLENYKPDQVITLTRNNYSYEMIKQKGISNSEFIRRVLQAIRLNKFTSIKISKTEVSLGNSNGPTRSSHLNDGHSVHDHLITHRPTESRRIELFS